MCGVWGSVYCSGPEWSATTSESVVLVSSMIIVVSDWSRVPEKVLAMPAKSSEGGNVGKEEGAGRVGERFMLQGLAMA